MILSPTFQPVTCLAQFRLLLLTETVLLSERFLVRICKSFLPLAAETMGVVIKLLVVQVQMKHCCTDMGNQNFLYNQRWLNNNIFSDLIATDASHIFLIYSEGDGPQPTSNWKGVFSISSYTQYFNVDTDDVLNRLLSSLYPVSGDFFSRIDANPDLYGLVWISTTLVFVIASLGNCGTYLIQKRSNGGTSWTFDVGYLNVAAIAVYGYALLVPLAFYFLLQYLGSKASLVRFWCMWGYSLFIFILSAILLMIPVEFLRWIVILISGAASASFVALNLRSYVETNDVTVVLLAAFLLQMALAIFIKMWFFP